MNTHLQGISARTQSIIAVIAALTLCGNLAAGSIYKCTDATGNITFSQTACPTKESGDQIGYSAPSQRRSSSRGVRKQPAAEPEVRRQPQIQPDYRMPTPMEQVRQLDIEKEKKAIKRRQWQLDKERRVEKLDAKRAKAATHGKELRIDRAKCDYYNAKARSYEMVNEENYRLYKLLAAESCK